VYFNKAKKVKVTFAPDVTAIIEFLSPKTQAELEIIKQKIMLNFPEETLGRV
jgi:hypothetical protein